MKTNSEISAHLSSIAQLMRLDGNNSFSCSAFEKAADAIQAMTDSIVGYKGKVPGVGASILTVIKEFVSTGSSARYQDLTSRWSPDALKLTVVPGIGPKTAIKLFNSGIKTLEQLKAKADAGELDERLTKSVHFATSQESSRIPLPIALSIAEHIQSKVNQIPGIIRSEVCGSLRRRVETIKDIDIVACMSRSDDNLRAQIASEFSKLGESVTVGNTGRSSIRITMNGVSVQIDLWIVEGYHWGAALNYATGSKNLNLILRSLAKKNNLFINEYGIYEGTPEYPGKRLGGEKEEDLYQILGIPYHPPELREDSLWENIPALLTQDQVDFDGHCHSLWSPDGDSNFSIANLATACRNQGYKTCCVTDHSYSKHFKYAAFGEDIHPKDIESYIRECREAEQSVGIRVLAGLECDILLDGSLQWSKDHLKKLDYILGAIHRSHGQNVTERYIKAMESGMINGIAHPMTRLFGSRPIAEANWDLIIETAKKNNVALEINGTPDRLDLSPNIARKASLAGVKLFLSSDAHSASGIDNMKFAVMLARKAGLTKDNLVQLDPERRSNFSIVSPGIGNRATDL